ncbi:dTDP-4-dehydrorhamnose reductase [Burkholderia dolosa]|uniref:dTDP-4-dehydrorhamnose reductase n=1 Tax=Burkholderia dolosa TaxID=152500 RepID=UPI001B954E7D|nr:dTDP-4-dehydrorhamnose reductase [Burkholderia dolosa]MBR8299998.1 dTDP-4-dehydrorhamnose reductase [Burkholderia dolosa]MDN7447172.1 dTDP-4-dehydrorhamnose reductase [Burkholderia multivorans]
MGDQRATIRPVIMLTGARGQLGFELRRALSLFGDVVALDRARLDLADHMQLSQTMRNVRPRIVVNAGGYTAVDRAESERELAQAVNADGPAVLAREAAQLGSLMVHYSTDYVFDGTREGWYRETDSPNPLSVYGQSKLGGERAIEASGAAHAIIRTSWVFGVHGGNFLKTIIGAARRRESLSIVADQYGAPTPVHLIADVTAVMIARYLASPSQFPSGVYHAAAAGETTWFAYADYALRSLRAKGVPLRVSEDAIVPIPASEYPSAAPRPLNSRMDTAKLRDTFGIALPNWECGVDYVLEQLIEASQLMA